MNTVCFTNHTDWTLVSSIVGLNSSHKTPINQKKLTTVQCVWTCKDFYSIPLFLFFYNTGGPPFFSPVHPSSLASPFGDGRGPSGMRELILSCQTLNLATVNNFFVVQCSLMS